jgi:protein gp37/ParB-like chromosome segregation protein Spo0J
LSKLGIYEVHPIADEFPLINGEEFEEMVAGIEANGLLNPILLTADGNTLVDGRNRYRACDRLNIEPRYERLPADITERQIVDRIISLNMHRRDLETGQKAMLALRIEQHIAKFQPVGGRPKQNEKPSPNREPVNRLDRQSAAKAAAVVGTSRTSVAKAKAVDRDYPDLAAKVRQGEMKLDAADKERKRREAAKPKIADPAPKPARTMLTLFTNDGTPVEYPQPQSAATFNESKGDGISWAGWSWNPVTGCLHGCDYCYAREIATSTRTASAYPVGFTPLFHHERLDAPANTNIPAKYRDDKHKSCGSGDCQICAYRRVFVCSMADLYGRWVPDEWIQQVHTSMLSSPQWQYILLTKFPARYVGLDIPNGAWVGTSVDEQKRVRIAQDAFAKLPDNCIKWLSLEPLLEPLQFDDLSMFDWVVIGAQTGTDQPDGRRESLPPNFAWVSDIYQKAREGGCKVHFKPNIIGNIIDGKSPDWVGMRFPDEYPSQEN